MNGRRSFTYTCISRTKYLNVLDNHNTVGKVKAYKNKIEQEILKICKEIQILLEELLIPKSDDDEATIFYFKLYVHSISSFMQYIYIYI